MFTFSRQLENFAIRRYKLPSMEKGVTERWMERVEREESREKEEEGDRRAMERG